MKFAILGSRGFPSTYGGYETLVRYLAPYLTAQGHEVTVYCRSSETNARVWEVDGITCVLTPGLDTKSLSTLSFGLTAAVHVKNIDAALVLNIANGFWVPLLAAKGIPTALNTDGIEWERGKWGPLGKRVFRGGAAMSARYATRLIADSQAIGEIWNIEFGVESTFIPYGAPVLEQVGSDRLPPLKLTPGSYALAVARLIPENNVDLTLDAIEFLGARAPQLVVVGTAGFDAPIEQRLLRLQQSGKVLWLGHVADQQLLTELWAHAGVYVHGHSVGGTNPALLQALGAGAPTLVRDTVFNREVLRQYADQRAYADDYQDLACRLTSTIEDRNLQSRWSDEGREIVTDHYMWSEVCKTYEETLIDISSRAGHR